MRPQRHGMQRSVRHIFADAVSGRIVDAHKNHGRDHALADQPVAGLIDLPFHSGERGRRFKQVLTVIQIEHGVTASGIGWIVVCRRQPHAQESRVMKNAAAEFVQAQISRRGLRTDHAGGSGVIILSLLGFFHPEKRAIRIQRRPRPTLCAPLILITIAKRLIPEISASEIRHKMHQVINS